MAMMLFLVFFLSDEDGDDDEVQEGMDTGVEANV
jgi:hypothetical protein